MSTPLDHEFETQEQVDSYDRWFRERVQRSLDDPRPSLAHDDVMSETRTLLESKRASNPTAPGVQERRRDAD